MLLGVVACTGQPADTADTGIADTDTTTPVYDRDNDGWTSDVDCDDMDGEISPEAEEHCDGADNDCDGETDESDALNTEEQWPDADDDGYGAGDAAEVCPGTEGYADNADDCDDGDAEVHPGADESCEDARDTNCDGALPSEDGDGDGYAACEDCDDGDPEISDEVPLLFESDFESEPEGMTLNGDASLDAGMLRLTVDDNDTAGTALLAATVSAERPLFASFSVYMCCGGSDGVSFALLDADVAGTDALSEMEGGGLLALGGIAGNAVTLDTYFNDEYDDISSNAIGVTETRSGEQIAAADVTAFEWDDAVLRAIEIRLEPDVDGAALVEVTVDDEVVLSTSFTPVATTWRIGFAGASGSYHNEWEAVDDVAIHACGEE